MVFMLLGPLWFSMSVIPIFRRFTSIVVILKLVPCGGLGGINLTPYYPFAENAAYFHRTLKETWEKHHPEYYAIFKPWCDEYFYLKHRQEMRRVGGIFFDYQDGLTSLYRGPYTDKAACLHSNQLLPLEPRTWEDLFAFINSCGQTFFPAYVPIVEK